MRPAVLVAAVALVAAGTVTVADVSVSAARPQAARTDTVVSVGGAALVCPQAGADASVGATSVSVVSVPAADAPRDGRVTMTAVPGGRATTVLNRPETLVTREVTKDVGKSEVLVAEGGLAGGLEAVQATRRVSGPYRGISMTRCVRPGRDWWFVGASGALGYYDGVYLVNTERTPALVDVSLWSEKGPLDVPRAEGIEVPPHSRVAIGLGDWAPDQQRVALHVVARAGRVAAAVADRRHTDARPDGVDWLVPAAAPGLHFVVPGFAAGVGDRRLLLAVPGADDAIVTVRIVGSSGAFVPTALAKVQVPGGTVQSLDIGKALGADDAALEVTSDRPVLVSGLLRGRDRDTGYADTAWTAAAPALDGPAVVAATRVNYGNTTTLLLSAPAGAARVEVRSLAPAPERRLTAAVPAGRTVTVDVASLLPASSRYGALVVRVLAGGPVHAAALVYEHGSHGPLFSLLPLVSPERTATLPPVQPDVGAGL